MRNSNCTTSRQFSILLEELRKRPEMAKNIPTFGQNRQRWDMEWEAIRGKLNAQGPPVRVAAEWKKVWSDLKTRTLKKLADNAVHLWKTGGGPRCYSFLTSLEQEVNELLALSVNVVRPVGMEGHIHGPRKRLCLDEEASSTLVSAPRLPSYQSLPKRRKTDEEEYLTLLQEQNEMLKDIRDSSKEKTQLKRQSIELKRRKTNALKRIVELCEQKLSDRQAP